MKAFTKKELYTYNEEQLRRLAIYLNVGGEKLNELINNIYNALPDYSYGTDSGGYQEPQKTGRSARVQRIYEQNKEKEK